ncbi:MAG: hypothetical protein IPM64_08950 [Phycisphaerales bacterium]|nr:hypothetical protein [Phycisphaerales bacterium]
MSVKTGRCRWIILALGCLLPAAAGCTQYSPVVRPTPTGGVMSEELHALTDQKIATYLDNDVRPIFPTVLALARLEEPDHYSPRYHRTRHGEPVLIPLAESEHEAWRSALLGPWSETHPLTLVEQIHVLNPLLAPGALSLKQLRDSAALVHAPLLLVYRRDEAASEGYNDAAAAYWTIVGLFVVPGNTVGHMTIYSALLIDTRSGAVLAIFDASELREERTFIGTTDIAAQRLRRESRETAHAKLVRRAREAIGELALTRGVPAQGTSAAPPETSPVPRTGYHADTLCFGMRSSTATAAAAEEDPGTGQR